MFNFESVRNPDGKIDLKAAYKSRYNANSLPPAVDNYLEEVEKTFPIVSRQVAAHILVNAHELVS